MKRDKERFLSSSHIFGLIRVSQDASSAALGASYLRHMKRDPERFFFYLRMRETQPEQFFPYLGMHETWPRVIFLLSQDA
ncbi:unnamed protein product [Camellia sinensis]